ncbi:MAG: HD family phosphohydrolase [Desulfuromonas sp.]|nr:MAG: HD family phosphohydrolase [Desulfuromonas sp.]
MKTVFVNQIRERDWVDAPFLVREKILAMAKNGRPYLTLKLMDRTGEVEGKVWEQVDDVSALFEKNDFVRIAAKASVYLGKMQLVIQQLTPLHEAEIELGDYLPMTRRPIPEMVAELQTLIASLCDQHLRRLMESLLEDPSFLNRYSQAPAAKSMHHVYLGGLLEHSLAVAALAEDICRRYPGLDRDLLLAGALLHDIGKIDELSYERSFQYTDAGKLLGHIMIGVELIDQKIRSIEGFPAQTALLLKHLMLSHHGQYEYGSPKRPKTMEAVILNFLDDLDSKINGVRSHIEREPDRESSWTEYHRLYDRYFYKGEGETSNLLIPEEKPCKISNDPPGRQPQRSRFSNTLEDQLRDKRHGLSSPASEDDNGT